MFDNVRRVARQIVAYGTADVTPIAINALLVPLFARVVTPPEIFAFGLLLGWEAIIKVIFRWGLEPAFLRLYFDQPDDAARKSLAGTIAIVLAVANGAVLLLLIALSGVIDRLFFADRSMQTAFIVLAVNSFVAGFFFLPITMYRAREQAGRSVALTVSRSLATIVLRVVLVIGARLGVLGFVLADLIVSVALTLALANTYRKMLHLTFDRAIAREALTYGLPHVPFGLLHQAAAFADRFLLGLLLPASRRAEGGAYQMGATIASLLKLAPVAFQTAWMPFAYDTYKRRPDAARVFARLATYWLAVLSLLTVAVATLTGSVVRLILPPSYWAAEEVIPWLALGVSLQAAAWLPTTSLNIAKATRYYPIITTISAIVALGGTALLIPRFGMIGAAAGMLIGQLVQLVVTLFYSQRVYLIPYETARMAKIVVVAAATWAVVSLLDPPSAVWTLVGRTALLALFPAGLFVVRLFSAVERQELRVLLAMVTARTRRIVAPPAPPPDETVL